MTIITANELKTKGVSNLEKILAAESEVVISVHGKPKYVVMEIEQYEVLREHELEATWRRVKEDVAEGRYRAESADEHMARIRNESSDAI